VEFVLTGKSVSAGKSKVAVGPFTLLDRALMRLLPGKNPRELVLLTMRGHRYGGN
jgi:hypothetical protein